MAEGVPTSQMPARAFESRSLELWPGEQAQGTQGLNAVCGVRPIRFLACDTPFMDKPTSSHMTILEFACIMVVLSSVSAMLLPLTRQ